MQYVSYRTYSHRSFFKFVRVSTQKVYFQNLTFKERRIDLKNSEQLL